MSNYCTLRTFDVNKILSFSIFSAKKRKGQLRIEPAHDDFLGLLKEVVKFAGDKPCVSGFAAGGAFHIHLEGNIVLDIHVTANTECTPSVRITPSDADAIARVNEVCVLTVGELVKNISSDV